MRERVCACACVLTSEPPIDKQSNGREQKAARTVRDSSRMHWTAGKLDFVLVAAESNITVIKLLAMSLDSSGTA